MIIAGLVKLEWFSVVDNPTIHVFVVWVAIVALATRAAEEGLQPAREVERYSEYRSSLLQLLDQFRKSDSAVGKLSAMREVERVSYQEMRGFVRINDSSRFIL
jgi:hypothetical protein